MLTKLGEEGKVEENSGHLFANIPKLSKCGTGRAQITDGNNVWKAYENGYESRFPNRGEWWNQEILYATVAVQRTP